MLAMKQSSAYELHQSSAQTRPSGNYSERTGTRVEERRGRSILDKVSLSACVVVSVAAVWFIAGRSAQIDKINYSIDKMQTQVQKTSAENASLSTQVDQLTRPSRLLSIALGRLHMQYANPVHIAGTGH